MHLREIILHNLGVFLGRHRIALSTEQGKPVVLVGGMNGRGKTTLLDSIQLALYGRRSSSARRAGGSYEDYLGTLIHHQAMPAEAAVSLEFSLVEDGAEIVYRVERVWVSKGSSAKETLTVWVNELPDPVAAERWADIAEGLLPVEIAELFFFDGEKIEQLADPSTAAKVIEAAVHGLLGVGLVERLQRDLNALQRRWKVEDADHGIQEKVAALQTELAALEERRELAVQERAAIQNSVDDSHRRLAEARHEFTRNGGDLAAQRESLERERADTAAAGARLKAELIEIAAGPLPLALVRPLLDATRMQADAEQGATTTEFTLVVLANRDETTLASLSSIGLAAEQVRAIKEILDGDRAERAAAASTPVHLGLGLQGPALFSAAAASMRSDAAAATRLIQAVEQNDALLADIERRLDSVPPDAVVARLAARVTEAEAAAHRNDARALVADEAIDEIQRLIADVEVRLARILDRYATQINAADDRARMQRHADKAHDTLGLFRERMVTRQLGVIEVSVLRSFQQLLGKKGLVDHLTISPEDFSVTLHGTDGERLPPERLSAGERQLLATALLWGLARASGRRLPMAIDTPLGRLDSDHRRNLVERYFPAASGQMILLSTDEEINQKLLDVLAPHISRTYLLSYDDDRKATSVKDGYFWESAHVA